MNVLEEMSREDFEALDEYMRKNSALEKKAKKLVALMNCVKNLGDIERSVNALSERLVGEIGLETPFLASIDEGIDEKQGTEGTDVKYVCIGKDGHISEERKEVAPQPAAAPAGWYRKESSKHPGKFYYVNEKTGATSWKMPVPEPVPEPKPMLIPLAKEGFKAPPGLAAPQGIRPPPGFAPKVTCKMTDCLSDYSTDAGGLTDSGDYSTDYDSDVARPVGYRSSPMFLTTKKQSSADWEKSALNAFAPVFQPQMA